MNKHDTATPHTSPHSHQSTMSSLATPRADTTGDVPNIKSLLKLKKKYDAPEDTALPESYRRNSEKELLWLWCANNLVRQLKFDFPHLRPLCLTPSNECGVKKLICTFVKVKPSLPGLSGQIKLIPSHCSPQWCPTLTSTMWTSAPNSLPTSSITAQRGDLAMILHSLANMFSLLRVFDGQMNSPTRVINEQTGNSFEMSVLLVSLLR